MILVVALTVVLCAGSVRATTCDMSVAFWQSVGQDKTSPVLSDKNTGALLFARPLAINTDGTRRSYSVGDFWGTVSALNNLCNAMTDGCAGLDGDARRLRRIATQTAYAHGWPMAELRNTRISREIIPFKEGKPCPSPDGYLVSATALHVPHVRDVCDRNSYVDALRVPTVVLPGDPPHGVSGFASRGAAIGDLAVAAIPGDSEPRYASVGDVGPWNKLGEGSIALNGKLLRKTDEPKNYIDLKAHWDVALAVVLIFPNSRDRVSPYMTVERIDQSASKRFTEWGGIERLKACSSELVGR